MQKSTLPCVEVDMSSRSWHRAGVWAGHTGGSLTFANQRKHVVNIKLIQAKSIKSPMKLAST